MVGTQMEAWKNIVKKRAKQNRLIAIMFPTRLVLAGG